MTEEDFKKYEKSYRQYYGENYDKALNNLKVTKKQLKEEFVKEYPNAHLDRFSFNMVLSKTGDVTGTSVSFKVRDGQFLNITTNAFKEFILWGVVLVAKNMGDYRHGPTVRKELIGLKRKLV